MSGLMYIPIGFRFDPTDEELITGFLLRKIMGLPLPWNGFLERDLYGENAAPWDVFADVDESSLYWHTRREGENCKSVKKTIYVFTRVTKLGSNSNSNSKRISRKAGCGTWNGQTGPRKIKDSNSGEIIGATRMLTFQHSKTVARNSSETAMLGHWIMHEYSLDSVSLIGKNNIDLVLCKITKCLKENVDDDHDRRVSPRSCLSPPSGSGGSPNIQTPTTGGDGEVELRTKRCAEECHEEDVFDHKKQKSSRGDFDVEDGDIYSMLVGLEGVENWSIDELLQGCDF